MTNQGEPQYFFLKNANTAILVPKPIGVYPVRILVALKPTQAAQGVDESIFEEYKDAIKHGALAYLMLMAEKLGLIPICRRFIKVNLMRRFKIRKCVPNKATRTRKTFRTKAHYI